MSNRSRKLPIFIGLIALATTTVGHRFNGFAFQVLTHPVVWNLVALVVIGLIVARLVTAVYRVGVHCNTRIQPHMHRIRPYVQRLPAPSAAWSRLRAGTFEPFRLAPLVRRACTQHGARLRAHFGRRRVS